MKFGEVRGKLVVGERGAVAIIIVPTIVNSAEFKTVLVKMLGKEGAIACELIGIENGRILYRILSAKGRDVKLKVLEFRRDDLYPCDRCPPFVCSFCWIAPVYALLSSLQLYPLELLRGRRCRGRFNLM